MGAERDAQNSYPGWKRFPKLIMTGGLTGTLDGLPVDSELRQQADQIRTKLQLLNAARER